MKLLRRKIIRFLIRHLFRLVPEEDILKMENGQIRFKGQILPREAEQKMARDASDFAESTLWTALRDDIQYQANGIMFYEGKTPDDLFAGRVMVKVIEIIDNKVKSLAKLKR